jgi:formylglycine-generating enzyme required for sulfatase activity
VIKAEANANPQEAQRVNSPAVQKLAPELSINKTGSTKGRRPIIIAGICVLLIVAFIGLTTILSSKKNGDRAANPPTAAIAAIQPTAPAQITLPTTDNPNCGTIVTLDDKTSWLFGATNIPFDMQGLNYRGIIVSDKGLLEVSDGAVEEVRINNKTLTLLSNDLKDGMVLSKEFGAIKVMALGSINQVCVLLVATPEQVLKMIEWVGGPPAEPALPTNTPEYAHAQVIAQEISEKDGMVQLSVPQGEFTMGLTDEEYQRAVDLCVKDGDLLSYCARWFVNDKPQHTVWLDDFWIDQTEVTNAMYAGCVAEGTCRISMYADDSNFNGARQPVVGVDWNDANAYCEWAGRRLPTEAEWEKAAGGTDGRIYPWGDQLPDAQLLNYNGNVLKTTAAGTYPTGASPYGALDMAGNANEWVADWFGETYYASSAERNPPGPAAGEYHVLRGGSWSSPGWVARSTSRPMVNRQLFGDFYTGFRCATSSPAAANPPPVEGLLAAGEWAAATDFGNLIFTVDTSGTKITKMVFQFSNWECGPLPGSVQTIKTATIEAQWPITYGSFSIFNYIDNNTRQSMTLNGVYDPASKKFSGTWEESSYGTRCSGIWEAGAPK